MQVKELKQEGLAHALEVIVDAKDIDKLVEAKLKDVAKSVRVAGFRPGKAPLKVMKQKYGKAVLGEVLESAVNDTSKVALENKGLKPALQPKIEVTSFDEGKDLVYKMELEVLPEFDVADYNGLKLEKQVVNTGEKECEEALQRVAEQNAKPEVIKNKRKTKDGDTVVIDFKGRTADDNVEHDGMQSQGHSLRLGSNQFIPGFEDQLIGKDSGEKVEVKVSFPENYGAEHLAGREAIFDVDIHEIQELVTPEVNDEFAKSLGLDDLKALEDAVKEQVQKEFDQHSRLKLKKALLDQLDEQHSFDVPPTMLEMEHKSILQQIQIEQNKNPQDADKDIDAKEQEELKIIAQRRVRLGLILAEIGNKNNISVADPELQKAVISEAQKYPGQEKEVFDYYSKNPQALESIRAPLFEDKVVDFILELCEIKEVEVSVDELISEDDLMGDASGASASKSKKSTKSTKSTKTAKTSKKSQSGKAEKTEKPQKTEKSAEGKAKKAAKKS